ncbi:TPA: EndoU domain-containing protein [Listeria innocua]|nr:EndoU domain-containing protein [Listeria innocua]HBM3527352.1 EndoU domain-containing protein [Listeria innocua]HBM3558671.1 EndoU domain-containing protein [Listeria innocua]HBM3632535.1 EndoU domain-containing protein [Listeria innocua]HBM3746463.1 EndoU domain-containing protein [Listeria innocua]
MSRIDIGEIRDFAFQLRAANQTGRKIIQGIKTTVTNYIEDGSLKGKAVESSKNYYQMTYIPLCDTITEAMNESEERLKRYIQDFHDQVDPSPNAKIDADGLYELGQMIDRIESKKEALYQRMNSSTEGQMQTYRSQLATAYKQENILEKYLAFEQSHGAFFDHLTDLVQGIQQTVRELQSNIQFDSQTGGYDLSKLNFATVSRMRKTLGKASATDATIYDFAAYSKVKQGGMWILSKDGKVDIKATEAYNTASFNGELPKESNQATEEGELLKATLESLKQNKDPITGQEISKAQSFGILTSLVFGYATKGYRGKKLTISKSALIKVKKERAVFEGNKKVNRNNKFKFCENVRNHLKNVEKVNIKKGVIGGHNINEFNNALKKQGVDIEELILSKKPHPTIEGIYEIEYRIPKKNIAGNIAEPISYKKIDTPKTVYDPSVFSETEIYNLGVEAMQSGKIIDKRVEGIASNGLKFIGYLDNTGKVKNFFPILD